MSPPHLIIHIRTAQPVSRGHCRVFGAHRAIPNEKTPCNAFPGNAMTERRNTFDELQAVYLKRHILHRQIHFVKMCWNSDTLKRVLNYFLKYFFPIIILSTHVV